MTTTRHKPTHDDLLRVIGQLQNLIGHAKGNYGNDQNPDGFERGQDALDEAFELCIDARGHFPQIITPSRNGWNFPSRP